ncbi:olfactory receptor 1019-like [Rhinatrema bivittatum]|uniref:olfactory receptor 1019-like n=1 Tax=Rhinatrema bivittatum TaxID=194408 RepID=UPI001125EE9F|nr:olfactory receptor 1019-like [Rhinatrema bivittatum]
MDLKIKLMRNKDTFCLMSGDADEHYKAPYFICSPLCKESESVPGNAFGTCRSSTESNVKYAVDRQEYSEVAAESVSNQLVLYNICVQKSHGQWNHSTVTEFLIIGLASAQEPHIFLFLVFLIIYFITLMGNLLILILITSDSRLHSPMYFFLANLSFIDLTCASITVPKMLENFLSDKKSISFLSCIMQLCCFQFFIVVECYLLAAMAYDRYVAICYPLNYALIMDRKTRVKLVAGCWFAGLVNLTVEAISVSTLNFCGPNKIDHFFCDFTPLLKLSCSDISIHEIIFVVVVIFCGMIPFLLISASYGCIVAAILKIRSAEGRRKTFSTCASHLLVVTLFYLSGIYSYIRPYSKNIVDEEVKVVAVIYTILTPMMNPLIYSLRNKEVKGALRKLIARKRFLQGM